MSWKKAVAHEFAGWPPKEYERAVKEVTELNDFAEKIGFNCHPDDRLGFGQCYFTNRQHVRVWHSPDGWVRAEGTSIAGRYAERQLFHTPQQALQNQLPFAVINRYGVRSAVTA